MRILKRDINLMKYLLVAVLLVWAATALSPQPIPTCSTPNIELNDLPISVNEIQSFNVNNLFTGFNLQFNLSSSAPDFVYLREKTTLVKEFDTKQPGLRSYHLEHRGNRWGRHLITLTEENDVTKIRWGAASANETIPPLTETVTVESEKGVQCYDAIWMREEHLAIVDCAKRVTFGLQNIFIYVNTTSQTILPDVVENDMYVGFTTILRRRMVLHRENEFNYLVRAYFASHVDPHHAHNTYIDIMSITNPLKPRTISVLDRSFLHQDELSITDFKLYNGILWMLDFHSGVTAFDFTDSQHILIYGRYRTDSGYEKMGIYSGNLDNEIIFVLANEHAIYQIDFTNQLQPRTIAKYSVMQGSRFHGLWVNEEYVIAQVSANVTTGVENQTAWYNSSIVFNRGTRTYLHAYDILEHSAENVVVDMEQETNLVMVIDPTYMRLYHLDTPMMSVYPTKQSQIGKQYTFFIQGLSINTYTNHSLTCSFSWKFTVVEAESMKTWTTGLKLPDSYYANFPGEFFIPLSRYVIGPNITWGVHESVPSGHMSAWWILQQNTTRLHWKKEPSMATITFLRQQQFDSVRNTRLFIYTQDFANVTHFLQCDTVPYSADVTCQEQGHVPEANHKILNLTAHRFEYYAGQYVHLAAIVYQSLPNEVFIYDADKRKQLTKPIIFPSSFEGQITGVEFLGHFLAVVLRYTKEIVFFDMRQCLDNQELECHEMYRIDSILMDRLGVTFFFPMDIFTSHYHPFVLFIQNLDRVIILAISRGQPRLLAQIQSPGSKEPGFHKWKMSINHDYLVIVNPPNIIEEHSLAELYSKRDAPFHRTYPLYKDKYVIPDKFDLDFSDEGDLIYITAEDKSLPETHNSVILVYRAGIPSVAAFYDVFNIGWKYNDMLIDATGAFGDYVTVAMGPMLHMFRQYQFPVLVFDDSFYDFDFNITYSNDPHQQEKVLQSASVKISNNLQKIIVNNSKLNKTDFLNDQIHYDNSKQKIVLDDSDWFKGNVINYTLEGCDECGKKLKVVNHMDEKRDVFASMDMDDYVFTHDGGIVQQFHSMISLRHNGSISQYIGMPAVHNGEECRHITHSWGYQFAVSACLHSGEVYLYLTNFVSFKPFVNGPHSSSASSVANIEIQGDLLMLVDVDENPSEMSREGGVLLYSLNHDIRSPDIFNELEFIDTTDLVAAQGWNHGERIYIGNAHLVYTNISQTYRLAITQLVNGVFFVDFKWVKGMRSIEILRVEFMDLREELTKAHLPMPNMAFFEAVTVSNEYYDPTFKYWQVELLVTTRNFHIFQVNCHFDQTGSLLTNDIAHVFYRYGFYETSNYIKTFDGYFAVVQKIPLLYQDYPWYSKQVVTVYDTRERWHPPKEHQLEGDIPSSYMLGGRVFPVGRVTFDFNFTLKRNETDPLRDIGLLVLHARSAVIRDFAIHDHIQIVTEEGISSTQNAQFVAFNDFSTFKLPLDVAIGEEFPGWGIALIVIGCLVVAGVGGFFCYRMYIKRRGQPEAEVKKSLLEEEGEGEASSSGEEDQDDDDEDDDEEDEDSIQEQKPVNSQPPTQPITSINRETVTSVDQGESQEKLEEPAEGDHSEGEAEGDEGDEGEDKKE